MKNTFLAWLMALIALLSACNESYNKAENAFDAGREFIDACLKGDFEKARFYMLNNDANDQQMQKLISDYRLKSSVDKEQYREASITILEESTVSDSVHIINYKNSFDGIARKVKVVDTKDGWLVDLDYTFDGNL